MTRTRTGQHTDRDSTVLAVRVPNTLVTTIMAACGGQSAFAEWARNVFRRACDIPLDFDAGYKEGYSAGWAEANAKFRSALAQVK